MGICQCERQCKIRVFLKVESIPSDQVMNDAIYLQESRPGLERPEKRKIVECITNKIVIAKEEITIDLSIFPLLRNCQKGTGA